MPRTFVQDCLQALEDVVTSSHGQEPAPELRRACEVVATAIETGRSTALSNPPTKDHHLALIIPALLFWDHGDREPIVIAAEDISAVKHLRTEMSRLASLSQQRNLKNSLGLSLFHLHGIRLALPREHYLCRARWAEEGKQLRRKLRLGRDRLSDPQERKALAGFIAWADRISSDGLPGDWAASHPAIWESLTVSEAECERQYCEHRETCHANKPLDGSELSNIILTTHETYLGDVMQWNYMRLPLNHRLIIDNTHEFGALCADFDFRGDGSHHYTAKRPEPRWAEFASSWDITVPDDALTVNIPPLSGIQREINLLLEFATAHLRQILGSEKYESIDPLAQRCLSHEPAIEDWLTLVECRLQRLVLGLTWRDCHDRPCGDDEHDDNPVVTCRRQFRKLARELRARELQAATRLSSIPWYMRSPFTENSDQAEDPTATELTSAWAGNLLRTHFGAPVYAVLDPLLESPTARLLDVCTTAMYAHNDLRSQRIWQVNEAHIARSELEKMDTNLDALESLRALVLLSTTAFLELQTLESTHASPGSSDPATPNGEHSLAVQEAETLKEVLFDTIGYTTINVSNNLQKARLDRVIHRLRQLEPGAPDILLREQKSEAVTDLYFVVEMALRRLDVLRHSTIALLEALNFRSSYGINFVKIRSSGLETFPTVEIVQGRQAQDELVFHRFRTRCLGSGWLGPNPKQSGHAKPILVSRHMEPRLATRLGVPGALFGQGDD